MSKVASHSNTQSDAQNKYKIILSGRGIHEGQWLSALQAQLPSAEIHVDGNAPNGWQADYALVWKPPSEFFDEQTQLRAIINLGVGVDALLKMPNLPKHVPILKLEDAGMGDLIWEYVQYGLIHFSRDFDRYRHDQAQQRWSPQDVRPLSQQRIGIMGTGAIGQWVAKRLVDIGYQVTSWGRSEKSIQGVHLYHGESQLNDFVKGCEYLVNLLPNTPQTQGLINADLIDKLADNSVIISCGRGEVVDEHALYEALLSGKLKGALLDVFQEEPLPTSSPLWALDNVLITPHVAAPTLVDEAVLQIKHYLHCLETQQPVKTVDRLLGY